MNAINWAAKSDAMTESLEIVEAHLNNFGLPGYNKILVALEQIELLTRESSRELHPFAIRDAIREIAAKALAV
jgi:hypothetical protein